MSDIFESVFSHHEDGRIISIGLTIDKEQTEKAIEISNDIAKKYKEEFTLDTDKRPPYVRLYETVFPEHNVEVVKNKLKEISLEMIPMHINWGSLEIEIHNIIVWADLSETLDIFHKAVLTELNPLREGYFKQKYKHDKQLLLKEQQESLIKWGSPWAQNYLPHMLIAKSSDKFKVGKLLELEWNYRKGLLTGIIVGEKNPDGKLKEFHIYPFKKEE